MFVKEVQEDPEKASQENDEEHCSAKKDKTMGHRDTHHVKFLEPDGEEQTGMFIDDLRGLPRSPEGQAWENDSCCLPDGWQPVVFIKMEDGEPYLVKSLWWIKWGRGFTNDGYMLFRAREWQNTLFIWREGQQATDDT
jgi:hypothetical protein